MPDHRFPRVVIGFGLAVALVGAACGGASQAPAASQPTASQPSASQPSASQPAASQPAAGGTAVSIVNFGFNPSSLTVKVGDTVTWTNTSGTPHTVTADDGSFDSGTVTASAPFQHTFSAAGTFAYHCTIHSSMKATIIVQP